MTIIPSYENDLQASISLKPQLTQADKEFELVRENCLRPNNFDNYIGQNKLKEMLKISISAAKKRKDPASLGHILLYGPPGLGKTSCAYLVANELGTTAKVFSAPAIERPKDILGILLSLQQGDVLFIDEIHRLNKITEELLYPALEDFQIDLTSGKGSTSRVMRLDINKFILVGATTKLGLISAPLRDRFMHIYRMEYYHHRELAQIALRSAKLLNIALDLEAAEAISKRGRGTPRIVNRLLRLVRDYAHHHDFEFVNLQIANEALDAYRIDRLGLDFMDRKILELLIHKYQGGPVGLEAIAALIGEDKMTVEDYNEPFLIQSGLLLRTKRGRTVTEQGFHYIMNKQ